MAKVFFPDLNAAYDFVKIPKYNTRVISSVSGVELRASLQPQPKFEIQLSFPVLSQRLKESEFKTLERFFMQMKGSFKSFYYEMMDDNETTIDLKGPGAAFTCNDGILQYSNTKDVTKGVQSPMMWSNKRTSPNMWNENRLTPMWNKNYSYTLKDGVIIFDRSLREDETIPFPFTYYYKCRFAEDSQQFTLFTEKLWKGDVTLIASLGDHI